MTSQENYKVNSSGYYGKYGGAFVPEMLLPNILELQENYLVKDVVEFLEKDKNRPICTPFSK